MPEIYAYECMTPNWIGRRDISSMRNPYMRLCWSDGVQSPPPHPIVHAEPHVASGNKVVTLQRRRRRDLKQVLRSALECVSLGTHMYALSLCDGDVRTDTHTNTSVNAVRR